MKRIITLVSLALYSFSGFAASTPVKTKLALNWKPEPEFGGFYQAKLGNHFAKRDLDVEIIEGGGGTPVAQIVSAGKVEFGISSADELVIAQDRGSDLVAIFTGYISNPQGVMVHEASGIKSMKDAFATPGNMAIAVGMPYTLYLKNKFKKDLKVTIVPYSGGVGTFLADPQFRQQCFVTSEPLAAREKGAKVKTFLIADEGYDPYASLLVTRRKTMTEKPELVKKMVEAVREGWISYLKDPKPSNEIMAKLNPTMTLATFNQIAELQKPFVLPKGMKESEIGKMTDARWNAISDALVELKLVKKKKSAKEFYVQ